MSDEVRVACKVMSERVGGRDVYIIIKTEYPAGSSTPGRTYVVGPQGQTTDTYEEMLDLLGVDPRPRPTFTESESNDELLEDRPPTEEMSEEELEKEIAELDQEIAALEASIYGVDGNQDGSSAEKPLPAASAGSAIASLDRAELERGFFDRFPPLPPTKKQYAEPDLSGPPEEWVERERQRRLEIFEDQYRGHPLDRDRRPDDELTRAELDMQMVRVAEWTRFVYPERYEAALDAEKYKSFFQRFPEEAKTRSGIKGPRCRFIRADGTKCGSPSLKNGRMCYFHSRTEGTHKRKGKSKQAAVDHFQVPVLEDDLAIQMAVTNVCRQLASEPLDTKRASLLLYGLQVASMAVRRTTQKKAITK